jgi:Dolichyl-phosphate-mannose-protein mannosyltransferase
VHNDSLVSPLTTAHLRSALLLSPRPWTQERRNRVVIGGVASVALCVLLVQALFRAHFSAVDEYDDGVYFGASVELVHGVLAYRSFAFIQPPLITVWMVPFAVISTVIGTAHAMEAARFFVDLVTTANVVLLGALIRRRSTLQVIMGTGVMAFSQGTIRSSQTILLEPFLGLACLCAFLCLLDGERLTNTSRRLWWCGILLGVAGATKVWAVFPFVAVLIVTRRAGCGTQRKIATGAAIGFTVCCAPFIAGAPSSFFSQIVLTQAIRNGGGYSFLLRLADLTGIPGLAELATKHTQMGAIVLSVMMASLVAIGLGVQIFRQQSSWSPLELLALWSALITGVGLLVSPTYYYHYSGFMAPFVALIVSSLVARYRIPLWIISLTRSRLLCVLLAAVAVPSVVALMLGASVDDIVTLPVAPQVGDVVSDAIPLRGCVLYANPTLALLDDRFTSDVSGCPDVIDWLGQERVLDSGQSVAESDAEDRHLQVMMGRWIESSDAVVLEQSNLGLDSANVTYLTRHFARETNIPRGLRIYVRSRPN